MRQLYGRSRHWLMRHWRALLLYGGGGLVVAMVLVQFLYPAGKLLPGTRIDGVKLSGWSQVDATTRLDSLYASDTLPLYFSSAPTTAYKTPTPAQIGLSIHTKERVTSLTYPWYLRLVPSSLFWAHNLIAPSSKPTYTRHTATLQAYITQEFGASSCNVQPQNASLKADGAKLTVVPARNGGVCQGADVQRLLQTVEPILGSEPHTTIPVVVTPPAVGDVAAHTVATKLTARIGQGVPLTVGDQTVTIAPADMLGWLDFAAQDTTLTYSFNLERATPYLAAQITPKVTVKAGVTQVTTADFTEVSRVVGASGQTLDQAATLTSLKAYLDGTAVTAKAAVAPLAPTVNYTRSYSPTDTGLSALMANFASSHPGSYGVSLHELGGRSRNASYHDTTAFTTASTYKVFVAYSSLLRIENGSWHWSDQIQGGNDLSTCFDKMIRISDNACAEALLSKIGYTAITNEAHAIGCTSTSFLGSNGIKTTAADLSLILGQLQQGQILSQQADRDRMITDMKNNIYRQGIPAGASGQVADKVGFLDDILNDAAIVYSPSGTYVLTIMTTGSSWANIAELTRQIEALRIQG